MIAEALKRIRPKLSVREAARRAGISEGWWRQVVRGYQPLKGGGKAPMTGSAATVAAMAQVVGVTPEQLEAVGRGDAAEELRTLLASDTAPDVADLVARVAELRAEADRLERQLDGQAGAGDPDLEYAYRLLAQAHEILAGRRRERRKGA